MKINKKIIVTHVGYRKEKLTYREPVIKNEICWDKKKTIKTVLMVNFHYIFLQTNKQLNIYIEKYRNDDINDSL